MTERKRVQVALTPEQAEAVERISKETGLSMSGVMQLAFAEWLKSRGADKAER